LKLYSGVEKRGGRRRDGKLKRREAIPLFAPTKNPPPKNPNKLVRNASWKFDPKKGGGRRRKRRPSGDLLTSQPKKE